MLDGVVLPLQWIEYAEAGWFSEQAFSIVAGILTSYSMSWTSSGCPKYVFLLFFLSKPPCLLISWIVSVVRRKYRALVGTLRARPKVDFASQYYMLYREAKMVVILGFLSWCMFRALMVRNLWQLEVCPTTLEDHDSLANVFHQLFGVF
jgi:hypothetical protein